MATKRMTTKQVADLVSQLDDKTLAHLICEANAEDRRRFDERCAQHPANTRKHV